MIPTERNIYINGNKTCLYNKLDGETIIKTVTFDGNTLNGIGDIDGTQNPYTLFTVTGSVYIVFNIYTVTTCVGGSQSVGFATNLTAIFFTTASSSFIAGSYN